MPAVDIFLSYQHEDFRAAEELHDLLQSRGRSVFMDRKRLEPGTKWEPRLRAELATARCVVVLWSTTAVGSTWVRREATSGYVRKRLVQVLLEPTELSMPFAELHAISLAGWTGGASPPVTALLAAIDNILRLPPGAPGEVSEELDALIQRLDDVAPEKEIARNLLLASWNLRAFGSLTDKWTSTPQDAPKRDRRSVVAIAEVIRRFDVMAVQEVRGDLQALRYLLSVLGDEWGALVLAPNMTRLGNNERTVFLYDSRRVIPDGLVDRLESPPSANNPGSWQSMVVDTPYAAFFRTRVGTPSSTFGLVTLRLLYGRVLDHDAAHELRMLTQWLRDWASNERSLGRSLLLIGDFGTDRGEDPLYESFVRGSIFTPAGLDAAPRTVFDVDESSRFVDHFAWFRDDGRRPVMCLEYTGNSGYIDFLGTVHSEQASSSLSWRVSDHYPLWIEFLRASEASGTAASSV